MANLHRAITNPVFGWYPKEIPCGTDLMPLDENYVPRKPDQIKISLTLEVSDGKEKDFSFYVTPYNGESAEFFLTETWNQYEKQAKAKLPANKRQDGPTHFRLLPLALGVTATTKWNKVLDDQGIDPDLEDNEPAQLSYKKFELCVTLFLEEVAGHKFLGDGIIRWLRRGRRPMRMSPDVAFDRRATLLALLDCGLLRSKLPKPNAYELAEAIFLAFPAAYQEKYAEPHEDIGEDLHPIRAAFTQYFAADVKNGTIKTLSDRKEKKKRSADDSGSRSNKRGRRPDRYSSGRGRRGGRFGQQHRPDRDSDRQGHHHRSDRHRDDRRDRGGQQRPPKDGNHRSGGHRDRGKAYKRPDDHAHHVDDGSRASRSSTSSSSRPALSRSPDRLRDEEEAYAMAIGREPSSPQDVSDEAPVEHLSYDDEVRSQHKRYYGSKIWDKFAKRGAKSHHSR